ncbi:MAG: sigma 54-interacting transcriptional regulator [Sporomusaceae bacterium]|nr:sigma 54-interacting transcriptional regulator [Sporomusaceae bacterium]
MVKILFLIPSEAMVTDIPQVLSASSPSIILEIINPREATEVVQQHIAKGVEIVAARPVTATALRKANLNIHVVTIPITSFDIIRAINGAKVQGKAIAVVAHAAMVLGIDFLAKELDVEIRHYVTSYGEDYEQVILQATAEGAEVILGGALAVKAAKKHNIPCSLIPIGSESLLQAAQEALQLQTALDLESAKRGFLTTILDHTRDGFITIDQQQHITAFNPIAQRILKIHKKNVLGKHLQDILPQIPLDEITSQHKASVPKLLDMNSNKILYDCVPIIIKGKSFGSVITLQETRKIQQMEAMIRKEIYAHGHVAKFYFDNIFGQSPAIIKTIEAAKDFAATNSSVLILGETGTGKEVFAQSIHNASKRASGPFVAINCASLPAQLLESELFGYVGGAFTGANKEGKAGLFEVAHGGTLFLDELGEMDYINQGRLLRVLQEKAVVRLGSYNVTPVDVRLIAATNKNLESLVAENKFRSDLYYRLNVLRLELPPLKQRKSDIARYAQEFLQEFSQENHKDLTLLPDALKFLEQYPWPGNIRECRNVMERLAATVKAAKIDKSIVTEMIKGAPVPAPVASTREQRVKAEILAALEETKGNYTAAAKHLGINRTTLYRRMERLNITY